MDIPAVDFAAVETVAVDMVAVDTVAAGMNAVDMVVAGMVVVASVAVDMAGVNMVVGRREAVHGLEAWSWGRVGCWQGRANMAVELLKRKTISNI